VGSPVITVACLPISWTSSTAHYFYYYYYYYYYPRPVASYKTLEQKQVGLFYSCQAAQAHTAATENSAKALKNRTQLDWQSVLKLN